jgi:hypothetical protein
MRYKLMIYFLMILLDCSNLKAQDKKIKFHSINLAGFLIGERRTEIVLQSVNGIAYKNLYSGLGVGADYYNYNSYPLFFDQRIFFGKKNNAFVYGDLGYNISGKNKPGKEIYYYNSYHFQGGVYTGVGIGLQVKFNRRSSILFSAGFSYKKLSDKIGTAGPADGVDYSVYNYGYGRIEIKTGIDF